MNKRILLIGVGGFGGKTVDHFTAEEHFREHEVFPLVFDTDPITCQTISTATVISLASEDIFANVIKRLGVEQLNGWLPKRETDRPMSYGQTLGMNQGAQFFRLKALVAFVDFLKSERRECLDAALERIFSDDEDCEYEVYTVASLSGGTGSGLFLPITWFFQTLFAQKKCPAKFFALLSFPDMTSYSGSDFQKTKMEANAYAALRELNAVSDSSVKAGTGESVEFPYWQEIFFAKTSAPKTLRSPFYQVYFVQRPAGVRSLDSYSIYVTDILHALCNGFHLPQKEEHKKYVGIALSELIYPIESILNYMVNRFAREGIDQWLSLFRDAEKYIYAEVARGQLPEQNFWGDRFLSYMKQSEERVFELFPTLQAQPLRGRNVFEEKKLNAYVEQIIGEVEQCFDVTTVLSVKEGITTLQKNRRAAFFLRKKRKYQALEKADSKFQTLLKNISDDRKAVFYDVVQQITEQLWAPEFQDRERSLFRVLELEHNHPMAALIRLCSLQKLVSEKQKDKRWFAPDNKELQDTYLARVAEDTSDGIARDFEFFRNKAIRRNNLFGKVSVTSTSDQIRKTINSRWCAACCQTVLALWAQRLEQYISHCVNIFRNTDKMQTGLAESLQTFLLDGSVNRAYSVFVGATPLEKETAYAKYLKERSLEQYIREAKYIETLSEGFWNLSAEGAASDSSEVCYDSAKIWWEKHLAMADAALRDSTFYRELSQKSLMQILLQGTDIREKTEIVLGKVIGKSGVILPYEIDQSEEQPLHPKRTSVLFFSKESINELSEGEREEKARPVAGGRTISQLIMDSLCMETEYAASDKIPMRKLLALGYLSDLELSQFSCAGELQKNPEWYRSYCDAEEMAEQYNTAMWYSHLLYIGGKGELPYLDARM